jgi:CheY-like chemotaxis protein
MAEGDTRSAASNEEMLDQIEVTQEVIQGLLEMLGEAWAQIEQLNGQVVELEQRLKAARTRAALEDVKQRPEASTGTGVVIIDDSKLLQVRMKATIEALGYRVVGTAGDGLAGADMVISRNPRLVILDYSMPIMDGLTSLRAFRQQRPNTKVIVVSAGLTEGASMGFLSEGVEEILVKPVQLDLLIQAVHRVMRTP